MSLIDKVTADKSAVAADQTSLDAANVQLNIDESALAAVHHLENPQGSQCCIVALRVTKKHSLMQVNAMLVHESVHIWQAFKQHIGERKPSREFEAYAIQTIAQRLMESYDDRGKR